MKLRNFVGIISGLALSVLCSTAVFAAPSYKIGAPIDTTTQTAVTDLVKDSVVAVPIDLYTDNASDIVSNFNVTVYYDKAVLEPTTVKKSVYSKFGETGATSIGSLSGVYAVNSMYSEDDEESIGTYNYTNDTDLGMVAIVATSVKHPLSDSSNANRVGYFFFKVVGDNDKLNNQIVKLNTGAKCYIKIGTNDDVAMESEFNKTNACAGAFQITISDTLSKYVHALYVSFDGGEKKALEECVTTDNKSYDFPVRVKSTNSGSVKAAIYADLGTADAVTDSAVKIAEFDVDLSGTATGYGASEAVTVE